MTGFISFDEIMRQPLVPMDWIVEGLIGTGDRVVIYGEVATMKSWIALDLGLAIFMGRPWLGNFGVPKARSVLYVDEEMNERTLWRRVCRLGEGAGPAVPTISAQFLSRAGVRIDQGGAEALLKKCADHGFDPDVIIVDTLRRVLVGNENEARHGCLR